MTRPRALFALSMALSCAPAFAADMIRVVNEGGIRDEWTLPAGYKLALPAYPAEHAGQQTEACVAIGYLINPDGSTSDFALLKSWTSANVASGSSREYWSAFAQASAQAMSQWRFQPRPEVQAPRPVYTVATLLFAAQTPQLRGQCAIPDLAAKLRELRANRDSRRRMDVDLYDRLNLDPLRYERDEQGRDSRETGARRTP